jgi:ATP-binding cassette subfamily F protein 3
MAILALNKVSLAYQERPVLEDCSFSLEAKNKCGLVGANGAGKTSLFRLLCGQLKPTSGEIITSRGLRVGQMEQELKNHQNTIWQELFALFAPLHELEKQQELVNRQLQADNLPEAEQNRLLLQQAQLNEDYMEQGGLTYQSRIRGALLGLGFGEDDFGRQLAELSGGQRAKLALAKLLLSDADLLLLDEPTNHLDVDALEWLEDFLRGLNKAYIVISHDRYFLDRTTEQTLHLYNHHIKLYRGNFSAFKQQSQAALEADRRHNANLNREIERLQGVIKQQKQWNRERNLVAAHSKEKAMAKLQQQLVAEEAPAPELHFQFKAAPISGQDLLRAEGLAMRFGDNQLFSGLDFTLRRGERVFLLGPNGVGKTTLFRLLLQRLQPDAGEVRQGAGLKIGYYDQVQKLDDTPDNLLDYLRNCYPRLTETELRTALAAFLFFADDLAKPCRVLSGGEKARLGLLKILLSRPNLLLLDEPTNHLDIAGREALEQALQNYDGAILAISHDRYFINALAERVVVLEQGGLTEYCGGWEYYLEKRQQLAAGLAGLNIAPATATTPASATAAKKTAGREDYQARKEQAANLRRLQNRLQKLENAIAEGEAEKAELENQLAAPELASDYQQAAALHSQLQQVQQRLEEAMAEWEQVALALEEAEK